VRVYGESHGWARPLPPSMSSAGALRLIHYLLTPLSPPHCTCFTTSPPTPPPSLPLSLPLCSPLRTTKSRYWPAKRSS